MKSCEFLEEDNKNNDNTNTDKNQSNFNNNKYIYYFQKLNLIKLKSIIMRIKTKKR